MQAIEAFLSTTAGTAAAEGPLRYGFAAVALGLILLEFLLSRLHRREVYDGGETLATLAISLGQRIVTTSTAAFIALPLTWVYQHRLFDVALEGVWTWLLLFLMVEFCYYMHHLTMHKVRWFWAAHSVHHSATRFNLSAALRLSWFGQLSGGFLFYLPPVLLGFDPLAVIGVLGLGLGYQFLLHLERAPRLGPLEWILNTPTHHRVHHASNDACLDRNFGNVLIVFDRLFGTFAEAPRYEALMFGLKGRREPSRRPLEVLFGVWLDIGRRLRRAAGWRERWAALAGRP